MKRAVIGILAIVGLVCAYGVPSHAQSYGCTAWLGTGLTLIGTCPQGTIQWAVQGPWEIDCEIWTNQCAPPAAASETCPTCQMNGTAGSSDGGSGDGGGVGGSSAGGGGASSGVALASGNTYIGQQDLAVPGLGGGLALKRTWNSLWPPTQSAFINGMFGPQWRSTYEERVFVGSDNYIKYARSDGSFWSFGYEVGGGGVLGVAAPANQTAILAQGVSYWTLTFKGGEQRLFDNTSGNLIEIIDRNGNATTLTYDGVNRLTTVTDPVSRHLYFSYVSPSSYLVSAVTSDFGVSLSYTYDSSNRLSVVTNPDGSTLNFSYNSQSLITSIVDSNGKVLESHSYDSLGRGLTASRANGVNAFSVTYNN
jgi:YD repeat-containing protein